MRDIALYNIKSIEEATVSSRKKIPVKNLTRCVSNNLRIMSRLDGTHYDMESGVEIEYIKGEPYFVEWL